jgi:hypothetical protein
MNMRHQIADSWPTEVLHKIWMYVIPLCRCHAAKACKEWAIVNRDESMWAMSVKENYPLASMQRSINGADPQDP